MLEILFYTYVSNPVILEAAGEKVAELAILIFLPVEEDGISRPIFLGICFRRLGIIA